MKWPGREVNRLLPRGAKFKNERSYASVLHICLIGVSRGHFNSTLCGLDGGRLTKRVISFYEFRVSSNFYIARRFNCLDAFFPESGSGAGFRNTLLHKN